MSTMAAKILANTAWVEYSNWQNKIDLGNDWEQSFGDPAYYNLNDYDDDSSPPTRDFPNEHY